MKLTFMGAGSTIFARSVIGDCMCIDELYEASVFALYDIDAERLKQKSRLKRCGFCCKRNPNRRL